jgi:hypothetical protein
MARTVSGDIICEGSIICNEIITCKKIVTFEEDLAFDLDKNDTGTTHGLRSSANVLYVSSTGLDNAANGSLASPFLTIKYAYSQASPTSTNKMTILVAPGTYIEDQIILTKSYINIIGMGYHSVYIRPSASVDGEPLITTDDGTNIDHAALEKLVINGANGGTATASIGLLVNCPGDSELTDAFLLPNINNFS